MAWALGGQAGYDLLRRQDETRVAPGADMIVALLRQGPSLILIDELLEYLISAGGVSVEQTTLRDETLSFLKRLTVAVGGVEDAVLVFSLQSSKRESLEYTALLDTVDHLAARKDQRREPVEGEEILHVIQRRLLADPPPPAAARRAAEAYGDVVGRARRAYARSDGERQQADEEGAALAERIRASYPFHPALIDVMRERWAAIPEFQRTRGALRFLAACLRAAHRAGTSRLLLGPGDVPLDDGDVRLAFFKEVGQREDFQPCLEHDFTGANARTRRIDTRRAREVTAESGRRPAARLATCMLMHSFGGLRRTDEGEGDPLPPGISESDLLRVCAAPDLDSTTIQACLKELREQCLYLHFDGARYCFKKDPNVTLLIEQEAELVARDDGPVRRRIRELLEERLTGQRSAILWPAKPADIPDREPRFLIAYLPLEAAAASAPERLQTMRDLCENHGNRAREFRNGIGLAPADPDQVGILRRAVRYLLAIERVRGKWRELNLTDAQKSQLREREATEKAAVESGLLRLYAEVWLPTSSDGALSLDSVAVGGRPLRTTLGEKRRALIHQRLMELLTAVQRKVFETLAPGKIVDLFQLGDGAPGIATDKVTEGFYAFLGFPRLLSSDVVRKAIVRGVETGLFAYATGRPNQGDDGRYQLDWSRIAFRKSVAEDEIDVDSGLLIAPTALPDRSGPSPVSPGGTEHDSGKNVVYPPSGGGAGQLHDGPGTTDPPTQRKDPVRNVHVSFVADRDSLYNAWNALANLADEAGRVSVTVQAESDAGLDAARLENGVLEPLRELGLIKDD